MTRLDLELVRRGLARSRAEAARAIAEARVVVDGALASRSAHPVSESSLLEVADPEPWVARSAHKLLAALDAFGIDPAGRLCLDVGASTGGFTQVLLGRGARRVVALDVGHGQLVAELRADPRVVVVEGVNARELDPASFAGLTGGDERPTLAVIDVSFIGLALVLPPVAGLLARGGGIVALIKPQFEVGRSGVRAGIAHDREQRHAAVRGVLGAASAAGLAVAGLIASPLPGAAGNREYLCDLRLGTADRPDPGDPTEWDAVLDSLD